MSDLKYIYIIYTYTHVRIIYVYYYNMLRFVARHVAGGPAAQSMLRGVSSRFIPVHERFRCLSSKSSRDGERDRLERLSADEVKDMPLEDLQDLLISTSGKNSGPRRNGLRKKRMKLRNIAKIKEHRTRKRQVIAANKRKHEKRQLKIKQTQRWTEYLVKGGGDSSAASLTSSEAKA